MAVNHGLGSLPAEQRMTDKPRCRILVVEDEAMIAMLVEDMVLDFGSEVVGLNVGGAVVYPLADLLRAGRADHFRDRLWGGRPSITFRKDTALSKPFSYGELAEALRTVLANQPCHTEAA